MHLEVGSEATFSGLGYSGKLDFMLTFTMSKDLSLVKQVILWSQFSVSVDFQHNLKYKARFVS